MILFIGTEERGYFIEEASHMEVKFSGYVPDLEKIIDSVILSQSYSHIIIDAEMLVNDYNTIAELSKRIMSAVPSPLIFLTPGYSEDTELIRSLRRSGVFNFITATSLAGLKSDLIRALEGRNSPLPPPADPGNPSSEMPVIHALPPYQTIAVAGCLERIGTTTQAIQLVKHLIFQGHRACYIELNENGYIKALKELYEDGISFDDELGRVTYQNVDMFYRKDKIAEVLRLGYEYYIYDFGIFDSVGFSLVSYLEKNLKIMVCGIKPNEASYMTDILASLYDKDIEYIFSFTHESDRKDILELMSDRAEHTFFAPWIPDPFVYSSRSRGTARQAAPGDPCGTIKGKETVPFLSEEKLMAKFKTCLVKEYKEQQAFQESQEKLKRQHNVTADKRIVVVEKSNMAKFTVKTIAALVKALASAILLCLAVAGLTALVYPSTRADLLILAQNILEQILTFLNL